MIINLFILQLKRAARCIPYTLMIVAVCLLCVLGMLGTLEKKEVLPIATVIEDDNLYTRFLLSYITEDQSVKKICTFSEMDYESALKELEANNVSAVIVIPKGFLQSIMDGTNISPQIILNKGTLGVGYDVLCEMINSAFRDLVVAQSAVYAVSEKPEVVNDLNKSLLFYALGRKNLFNQENTVSLLEIVASFIIAGVMLGCIAFTKVAVKENEEMIGCLKRVGISYPVLWITKLLATWIVYCIMWNIIYAITCFAGVMVFDVASVIRIALITFVALFGAFIVIYFANELMSGGLAWFATTVVLMFLSGNIVPDVFLPSIVNTVGEYVPTGYMVEMCVKILLS